MQLFHHTIDPRSGVSLNDQIESILEKEIRAGRWKVGMRLPTVRDLSEMTGLSVSPISDALTSLVRKGYLDRHVGRGTFLLSAAPEEEKRNGVIAMTIGGGDKPELQIEAGFSFLRGLVVAASHEIQIRGFSTRVFGEGSVAEADLMQRGEALSYPTLRSVDGILNFGPVAEETYDLARKLKLPLVCVGHQYPPSDVPFVVGAELQRIWDAVDILYKAGHRKIGWANAFYGRRTRVTHVLGEAYQGALRELGLPRNTDWLIRADMADRANLPRIRERLLKEDRPTAIICFSEESAYAIYSVASLVGMRIPEDLSVLALANSMAFGGELDPPLSTLVMPVAQLAERAVGILMSLIEGEGPLRAEGVLARAVWNGRGSISAPAAAGLSEEAKEAPASVSP